MDVVIAPPLFSVGEFGAKTKMISVGDARMALPSGRNVRSGKHLKNKRKLAWLLRHCYHEVLPPTNQLWGPSLGGSFQAVGTLR